MPDFASMVRQRLPKLSLDSEREEQVIAELAAHLEDCAEEGIDSSAVAEAINWARLGAEIRRAKESAVDRMKQLVIPGVVALVVSGLAQVVCRFLSLRTYVFPTSTTAFVLQWPWLMALPLAGAAGAYVARRAGATAGRRLLAALLPAVLLTPLILLVGVAEIAYRAINGSLGTFPWIAIAGYLVSWTIVPAIPLLLGASFFLFGEAEAEPRTMAHHA